MPSGRVKRSKKRCSRARQAERGSNLPLCRKIRQNPALNRLGAGNDARARSRHFRGSCGRHRLRRMRLGWLASAGVGALLVACGSGSHKKILLCGADGCGAEAGAAGTTSEAAPPAGGDGGTGNADDVPTDAEAPDARGSEAGASPEAGPPPEAGLPPEAGVPVSELQVTLTGNGSVAVTNAAACLTSPCSYATDAGAVLTLEAKPGADSYFVGWSGACSGNNAITTVTVSGSKQCIATFIVRRAVSVAVETAGTGTVSTTPDLACTALGCNGQVNDQSDLTLLATPASGFRFVSWSGGAPCAGSTQASLTLKVTADLACTAKFSKQFLLSISAAGAAAPVSVTSGTCTATTCTADAGSSAAFSAGTLANYRFSGWSGNALCTGTTNPLQFANIAGDIACVANYAARFKVTGLVGSGLTGAVVATSPDVSGVCSTNACIVDSGKSTTLVAPTIAGYRLTGWTGAGCTGTQSGNGLVVTPTTGDLTCSATYALGVSVTGTVVGATGAVVATSVSPGATCTPGSCGVDAGGSVTLTAPSLLPSYRFVNWTGDAGCAGAALTLTLSNVTSSKACNANYVQQFNIIAKANGGGTASAAVGGVGCAGGSCTVDAGTSVGLTATPDTANGYHFTAWSGAGCTPAAGNPLTLSNVNTTCTASFALNTFTIAATAGTNGSVSATRNDNATVCAGGSCTVNFGTSVTLLATPAAHYHFNNWAGVGCAPTGAPSLTLQNLNASCTAAFAPDTFSATVSAAPAAAGMVGITCPAGNCAAVPYGQPVNVTATANAGWSFTGWSANCNGGIASPNTVTIVANTACAASFRPRAVASVAPAGAGTITATGTGNPVCVNGASASCIVDIGGSVTFVAAPAANAVFSNWTGDCTGAAASVTLSNLTAPLSCTANFYQLWAQATGLANDDHMTDVTALADGTVVGFGTSLAIGGKSERGALVELNANTGKLTRNLIVADKAAGALRSLGLATTPNQRNVIALGVHSVGNLVLAWLHNEQAPAWDYEYSYAGGGNAYPLGGDVIATKDGGYAFAIGVVDAKTQGTMGHLTKVDADGNPKFDLSFCGTNADANCYDTIPVDVLEDPAGKYFAVLSQTQNATQLMLTFVNQDGTYNGSTRYRDSAGSLVPESLAAGPTADTFFVSGSRSDAKNSVDAFYALITKATGKATYAFTVGARATGDDAASVVATAKGYALAGYTTDANGGQDAWLALVDPAGTLTGQFRYAGTAADYFTSVFALPVGGFAVAGTTTSFGAGQGDMWTLRLDDKGALTFNPASGATRTATAYVPVALNGFAVVANVPKTAAVVVTRTAPAVTTSTADFAQSQQAP